MALSQIYGGGGNAGAPYQNDFVEVYNLGGATINLSGWSVQYASAASATWQVTALSGSIPPGGYWLVQEGSGGGAGVPLPTPDTIGGINLSATAGKVALVSSTVALSGACPASPSIVDFVGYGGTANCFEGSGPAPAPGNTISILRLGNGAIDTDSNSTDFVTGAPNPRTSSSGATPTPSLTPTRTSSPTQTPSPSDTPSGPGPTPTPTDTATGTDTPTPTTSTATMTATATSTVTITSTLTDIPTATPSATPFAPLSVIINEVAWGGTAASTADEWVELYNSASFAIDLTGWTLTSTTDGSPTVGLSGTISAGGYFLLERTDDNTISDIPADQTYAGDLANGGEALTLRDPGGTVIDTANGNGGAWPAGSGSPNFFSMERLNAGPDGDTNWARNNGANRNGLDANGNPINGTPKNANSTTFPTPAPTSTPTPTATFTPTITLTPTQVPTSTDTATPTPTPTSFPPLTILVNEVAWGGTSTSGTDEWIELYNPNVFAIDLSNWTLTSATDGSPTLVLSGLIPANGFFLLERTDDNTISDIPADQIYLGDLGNGGERLTLQDPGGNVIDTANGDGGAWPAGSGSPNYFSMERMANGSDNDGNWASNNGLNRNGLDAGGNPINGTPKNANSTTFPTPTSTVTRTTTATPTATPTFTLGPTLSPTATSSPTATGTALPPGLVIINEVAWGGTSASASDEWVELYNPNSFAVSITNWVLASNTDGSPTIVLSGLIPGGGYFLLERTDDNTVSDIPAEQIYSGDLGNSGEVLTLSDPAGNVIDAANADGGPWPAGTGSPNYASMERRGIGPASDSDWVSNNGVYRNGLDAGGNPINGTPKKANSITFPTPTASVTASTTTTPTSGPTPTRTLTRTSVPPQQVIINEVAWGGTSASASDEWIELYNPTGLTIDLTAWTLSSGDGSPNIVLSGLIPAGRYFILERTDDNTVSDIPADQIYTGDLGNGGEALSLYDPGGNLIDTANGNGGAWPAGTGSPSYASMERLSSAPDSDSNWASNNTIYRNGLDAGGNPINGTPKNANSTTFPTPTPSATPTTTLTPTFGPSPTPTHTQTPTPTGTAVTPQQVVINEVAWGGTTASSSDEWLELYNFSASPVDVTGWGLSSGDGSPTVVLQGFIPAGGYFLLERTDDTTVSDIPADQIYTGDLRNGGESLALYDNLGNLMDTANGSGGAWPAGSGSPNYYSMERINRGPDNDGNWASNNGLNRNGLDAGGNPINGTPKDANSTTYPTPTPTVTPSATATPTFGPSPTSTVTPTPTSTGSASLLVVLNEVAWGGTGASAADEWIELYNPNPYPIDITGWTLSSGDGSPTIVLSGVIASSGFFLLERTDDNTVSDIPADQIYIGDLRNGGESLSLSDALGNLVDSANGNGGVWPAGTGSPNYFSMERINSGPDADSNWVSNNGLVRNGLDANGNLLNGTPRNANASTFPTPTPTPTGTALPTGAVIINEIAWAGTSASSNDEWLELYNPNPFTVDLTGWTLTDGGDIDITFAPLILGPGSYLLLERTDDASVSDLAADVIYSGGLSNAGETLTLSDGAGRVMDTANGAGGWPAGHADTFASMERVSPTGADWVSNNGYTRNGLDANGDSINGTPKAANSALFPTPTPAPYPGGVLLNEFLPHPSDGVDNEFIELINTSGEAVTLTGWRLDDAEGGSPAYAIPAGTVIQPGAYLVFFRAETNIAINDDGDGVRLIHPDGTLADAWSFDQDPKADVSWARYPDGANWNGRGFPTPGGLNQLWSDASDESATPVPIGVLRTWSDGAWATITGRITGPAPLFGKRFVYIQDETGGIAVYLGRGEWGAMVEGQTLTVLGYLRHRTGEAQFYVRNIWHVHVGPAEDAELQSPIPVLTGQIGEATEGQLVTLTGRVVRLEAQAFWIDDGSGPARIFFSSTNTVQRPKVKRGQRWTVIGVVTERTTARDADAKFRVQPRFAADVVPLAEGGATIQETPAPPESVPTEEPTATPEP